MRLVILSVLVVCFACADANRPAAKSDEVSEEIFNEVNSKVQPFLKELARAQGHSFKLVRLIKQNPVDYLEWVGEFETNGEKLPCTFNIQLLAFSYNHFGMKCEKKYHVSLEATEP